MNRHGHIQRLIPPADIKHLWLAGGILLSWDLVSNVCIPIDRLAKFPPLKSRLDFKNRPKKTSIKANKTPQLTVSPWKKKSVYLLYSLGYYGLWKFLGIILWCRKLISAFKNRMAETTLWVLRCSTGLWKLVGYFPTDPPARTDFRPDCPGAEKSSSVLFPPAAEDRAIVWLQTQTEVVAASDAEKELWRRLARWNSALIPLCSS